MIYDSGQVPLEHLLLSWCPSQRGTNPESIIPRSAPYRGAGEQRLQSSLYSHTIYACHTRMGAMMPQTPCQSPDPRLNTSDSSGIQCPHPPAPPTYHPPASLRLTSLLGPVSRVTMKKQKNLLLHASTLQIPEGFSVPRPPAPPTTPSRPLLRAPTLRNPLGFHALVHLHPPPTNLSTPCSSPQRLHRQPTNISNPSRLEHQPTYQPPASRLNAWSTNQPVSQPPASRLNAWNTKKTTNTMFLNTTAWIPVRVTHLRNPEEREIARAYRCGEIKRY